MLSLGEYKGHELTVNTSNVDLGKVTYHVWLQGKEIGFVREDAIINDPFEGIDPLEQYYFEAERRFNSLGRPDPGEWQT